MYLYLFISWSGWILVVTFLVYAVEAAGRKWMRIQQIREREKPMYHLYNSKENLKDVCLLCKYGRKEAMRKKNNM